MSSAAKRALRMIFRSIDDMDSDVDRRKFKRLVRDACLSNGITGIDRGEKVYFARRMLDARISRTTIRDRLMARYELSRSQAYRVIEKAFHLSHQEARFATLSREDAGSETSF